jgi:hypothetical protein
MLGSMLGASSHTFAGTTGDFMGYFANMALETKLFFSRRTQIVVLI